MISNLTLYYKMEEIVGLAETLLNTNWTIDNKVYNLKAGKWSFAFNNRKKSLGLCDARLKVIYLSKDFVISNPDNFFIWNDTLRHEIAHAIDFEIRGKSDHSEAWKRIARQVGCETEHFNDDKLIMPISKYVLKCNNCGLEKNVHRKKVNKAACSVCCTEHNKGKFSLDYVLTVVKNY